MGRDQRCYGQVKSSQAKPSQAKSSQAKSSQVKSSQVKSRPAVQRTHVPMQVAAVCEELLQRVEDGLLGLRLGFEG